VLAAVGIDVDHRARATDRAQVVQHGTLAHQCTVAELAAARAADKLADVRLDVLRAALVPRAQD
jgi:hypothetical protein